MNGNGKLETVTESVDVREKRAVDLDHALNVAGIGFYNLKYCLVMALFLIAAIVEPLGYAYVLPAAKCDLEMTDAHRGFLASVPYIGIVLTSYPWGYLVDTKGRKRIAIYSSLAAGFFSVLSAFMPEIISFTICKFITSLCIAGPAAVPYAFIGEIVPQKYRDITMSVTNALQITGSALVPLLAWGILPLQFSTNFGLYNFRSWRVLVIVNASFFLISAFFMSFGPESPKYLVAQRRHDDALRVLQTVYVGNGKGKSLDDYPVKMLQMPDAQENKRTFLNSLKTQSIPLVMPPFLKWMALNGFLLFGLFATLNGLNVWVPDILNRVITGDGEGMTACEVIAQRLNQTDVEDAECVDTIDQVTYIINLVANCSCAVIAIAASSTVKLIGKKALIVIAFGLIGTFLILVNFVTQDMVFASMLSSLPLLGLALGPINSFAVQVFPTHLRGMAINLTMMMGRLGSVVGANVAGALMNVACEANFYLFGCFLLLCGVMAFLLPRSQESKPKKEGIDISTRL